MTVANFLQPLTPIAVQPVAVEAIALVATAQPSSRALSNFAMQRQLQENWCWAAVSTSVAVFFGATQWTQCKVAAAELGHDCCGDDASGPCNQPWYLDRPLTRVGHFDHMDFSSAPFTALRTEIDHGRPLCCRVQWSGGDGAAHFVALVGWIVAADGTEFVDVQDPYFDRVTIPYSQFVTAYRSPGDSWTHSYFTVTVAAVLAGAAGQIANAPKAG